jgi:hypothetical protein
LFAHPAQRTLPAYGKVFGPIHVVIDADGQYHQASRPIRDCSCANAASYEPHTEQWLLQKVSAMAANSDRHVTA